MKPNPFLYVIYALLTVGILCTTLWVGQSPIFASLYPTATDVWEQAIDSMMQEVESIPDVTVTDVVSDASSVVSSKPSASQADANSKTASSDSASSKTTSSKATSSAASKPKPVADKNKTEIVTYTKRPTYSSVQKEIKALQKEYPDLIQVDSIGSSVQGRDLTLMKIGTGKKTALVIGGIHAREGLTVSYVMRLVEEMCAAHETEKGYYKEFNMKNLFECYTLYVVPLANPDGLEIVGGRAKPSVTVTYTAGTDLSDYKGNANGVNLNRNFPFEWNKINNKVTGPHVENYKGPSAGSEPETKALMNLCENNEFMWLNSVHVRGNCVYWSDPVNPSVGLSSSLASKLESKCGLYKCPTSQDVNGYGGGFENWFRQQYKRPGFCMELVSIYQTVNPLNNENHKYFDSVTKYSQTYRAIPLMMIYGFIE